MQLRKVNRYITLDEHNHIMKRCVTCQRWKRAAQHYPIVNLYYSQECRECAAKQRVVDERVVMTSR